jgi:GNAT superfamily N-acetyltransferase
MITIRKAELSDGPSLSHIDSLCTQGKGVVFHYQRKNFFARSGVYKRWSSFIAKEGEITVGTASACIKEVRIAGSFYPVGYVYDLRVHPAWRKRGISYRLLEAVETYLRHEGARYAYTYVLDVNIIARRVSQVLGMHPAGVYTTLIFPCFETKNAHVTLTTNKEQKKYLRQIEDRQKYYNLTEKISLSAHYGHPRNNSPFRGIFRPVQGKDASVSVWDSSVLSTKVVDKIPVALRILDMTGGWLRRKLKLPRLPGKHKPLRVWHLFDIWSDGDDPDILQYLVKGVQNLACKEGIHMLFMYIDPKDSLHAILRPLAGITMKGLVLMRTPQPGEKPPGLKRIYLDVRDF